MDLLLLEDGTSYLLLENGSDRMLLELSVQVPTVPGMEYALNDLNYDRLHYAIPQTPRLHYQVDET